MSSLPKLGHKKHDKESLKTLSILNNKMKQMKVCLINQNLTKFLQEPMIAHDAHREQEADKMLLQVEFYY